MDNLSKIKAEFIQLGFDLIEENVISGEISCVMESGKVAIRVEIDLDGFPIKQPRIKLISINNDENLYKIVPKHWRHLDETIKNKLSDSEFYICCLHNWSAKQSNDANFIYERLVNWLNSNMNEDWNREEDLIGWRVFPKRYNSVLYVSNQFITTIEKYEVKKVYPILLAHDSYNSKNKSAVKKNWNEYSFEQIDQSVVYRYLTANNNEKEFEIFKEQMISKKTGFSKAYFIKVPNIVKFKTTFQLFEYLRVNNFLKVIEKSYKNFILIISYQGDGEKRETAAFLINNEKLKIDKSNFELMPLRIENFPSRDNKMNLSVGLLGVGTIGSQVAKLLVEKDILKLSMADYDVFSLENLGRHVLGSPYVGEFKSVALSRFFAPWYLRTDVEFSLSDKEVAEMSDILVVTVGNSEAYDSMAFKTLIDYPNPIIWAWMSPNNILQEIVITNKNTGCLNCYYLKTKDDPKLVNLHNRASEEMKKSSVFEIDVCGNPHTLSMMERTIFLATQITSILSYYDKHRTIKFDYVNYYWGFDDIIPTPMTGYLKKHSLCFCEHAGSEM